MKFFAIAITLVASAPAVFAAIGSACSASEGSGTCQLTSNCKTNGFTVVGACPNDPANVRCCIKKSCKSNTGTCLNTSNGCSGGTFHTGYCPGDSTIKCCVKSSGGGGGGSGTGASVLAHAKTQAGVPYSWGGGGCAGKARGIDSGANTVGFDCSGLTQYSVCKATGNAVKIPRTSKTQYCGGTQIARANMQVGDLIFYANGACTCSNGAANNVYHVAINAGNGKMWEARKPGTVVGESAFRTADICPYVVRYW